MLNKSMKILFLTLIMAAFMSRPRRWCGASEARYDALPFRRYYPINIVGRNTRLNISASIHAKDTKIPPNYSA